MGAGPPRHAPPRSGPLRRWRTSRPRSPPHGAWSPALPGLADGTSTSWTTTRAEIYDSCDNLSDNLDVAAAGGFPVHGDCLGRPGPHCDDVVNGILCSAPPSPAPVTKTPGIRFGTPDRFEGSNALATMSYAPPAPRRRKPSSQLKCLLLRTVLLSSTVKLRYPGCPARASNEIPRPIIPDKDRYYIPDAVGKFAVMISLRWWAIEPAPSRRHLWVWRTWWLRIGSRLRRLRPRLRLCLVPRLGDHADCASGRGRGDHGG